MKMKQRIVLAMMLGGIVGALFGTGEVLVLLRGISWWPLETPVMPVAMVLYGLISAVLAGMWAWGVRRMDLQQFAIRAVLFSALTLTYVFGGFHFNRLYFPKISALPSLLFSGAWTLGWGLGVWALLNVRLTPRASAIVNSDRLSHRALIVAAALAVVAGFSLLPPKLWVSSHQRVRQQLLAGEPGRPNLLLIVMDTTRADHLSCYGYSRKTTPNLDRLAQEGALFEQATSTAPWTFSSHTSLFTGLYLSQHAADWFYPRADDRLITLAELLREHGYQTAGFSNNPWVSQATNLAQGFEGFLEYHKDPQDLRRGRVSNWLTISQIAEKLRDLALHAEDDSADLTNSDVRRWFNQVYDPKAPFFLFINYMEPHFVYEPPEPYRSRFLRHPTPAVKEALSTANMAQFIPPVRFDQTTQAILTDLYDGEIAYLDWRIGELMKVLERRKLLDKTLVIVTADHGDSLGEHEIFGHQYCVYETLLHVPLIIRYPEAFPPGTRVSQPVSLVDLVPTLIELFDLKASSIQADLPGRSWVGSGLAVSPDHVLLAEYSAPLGRLKRARNWFAKQKIPLDIPDERYFTRAFKSLRQGAWKFIWASDGSHALYDLAEDPGETHDLLAQHPDQAQAMETQLQQLLQTLKPLGGTEQPQELDEATHRELRALGYLQ